METIPREKGEAVIRETVSQNREQEQLVREG